MRESNFSNPLQNRACLSISAVVYDRRGTYKERGSAARHGVANFFSHDDLDKIESSTE